jgi:isoleucyl-tRNA synthetase
VLKTHGLLVDDNGDKISKSSPLITNSESQDEFQMVFDPEDFLEGSTKLDGSRKFGYGVDVVRAWSAFKDCDKNMQVQREQLDTVNKEVKLFRDVIRVMLTQVQGYDASNYIEFTNLSIVDKMMMVRLLEFSR